MHKSRQGLECRRSCPQQWSDDIAVPALPPVHRYNLPGNQRLHLGKICSGGPHITHIDLEATKTDDIRFLCSLGNSIRSTGAGLHILTVTFPCFTASIGDFCNLLSGATGNCHLWATHWGQLYLLICTHFIKTVFGPSLIAAPSSLVLEVNTLTNFF